MLLWPEDDWKKKVVGLLRFFGAKLAQLFSSFFKRSGAYIYIYIFFFFFRFWIQGAQFLVYLTYFEGGSAIQVHISSVMGYYFSYFRAFPGFTAGSRAQFLVFLTHFEGGSAVQVHVWSVMGYYFSYFWAFSSFTAGSRFSSYDVYGIVSAIFELFRGQHR